MNRIFNATAADADEILALYRQQIGREFCPWNEHYPTMEEIEFDLSRDSLFIMRNDEGRLLAAISIDEDEAVDALECWSKDLRPAGEFSRVAVDVDFQNQGIAREMVRHVLDVMRERGFRSIHILVNKNNKKALASYRKFDFRTVGECFMYDQPFLCYEMAL